MTIPTAFIGLDYIIDIMHPDGKIARSAEHAQSRSIVHKLNQALAFAKSNDWLTVLVKVGFSAGYVDQPKHSPMFGRAHEFDAIALDKPGTAFHSDVNKDLVDLIVVKPRVSAFYGTNLDAALRARKIHRLVLAGVSSTWAVQSTARDAHDRDYEVLILGDACADGTAEEHENSMTVLSKIARIITVEDLPFL